MSDHEILVIDAGHGFLYVNAVRWEAGRVALVATEMAKPANVSAAALRARGRLVEMIADPRFQQPEARL